MGKDPSWEIQKAVFSILTGDSSLMNDVTDVVDEVDHSQGFPYVVIGDDDQDDWGTIGLDGSDTEFEVHTFSDYLGWKEAKQIGSKIRNLLEGKSPSLTGFDAIRINFEGSDGRREPGENQTIRHYIQRFSVKVTAL